MNAKTLLAIATAVAVLLAGLGAVGAVAADEPTEQPTDDELPGSDAGDADRDRDDDRANDSERERAHEHWNDSERERAHEHWNDSELNDSAADERPFANETEGEFGPQHADERPRSTGPMWGVSDRVPDHVTQMHETMRSYFDEEEPPYRFGETFRSITGEELPWSDEDHPRNDSSDDIRNGSDR